MAGVAVAALVASGTVAFGKAHKTVTLDVDGNATSVSTFAGDVEGLLAAQGVRLDDQDEVAPGLDTTLRDGSEIVVRYGRQVTVAADGKESDVWLNVTDAHEALEILASRGTDVRLVASRSGERAEFPLRLHDSGPVAVVSDGSTRVVDSGGDSVAAILNRLGIELDEDDRVSVVAVKDLTENGGKVVKKAKVAQVAEKSDTDVALQVQRVETRKVTRTSSVPHGSKTVEDSSRYEDLDSVVKTAGKDGERTKVFQETLVDGAVESRELVSDKETTKPVTEVVAKGTKERPAPKPATSSSTQSSSKPAASTPVPAGSNREIGQKMAAARGWTGQQWTCLEALWTRESNWNHRAQNPSSGAYGIPQSLPGTKMVTAGSDWATNPATQIKWGLGYIAGRYGTPCGAWGHSQSVGWY